MIDLFPSTKAGVAQMLGISERKLSFVLYVLARNNMQYTLFEIPKKNGDVRQIEAPVPVLKALQRRFSDYLYSVVRVKSCAYAFCRDKRKGIKGNAEKHRNKRWVVSLDLSDFFHTINYGRVRGLFASSPFNCTEEVATVFAQLSCYDGHLAQGSPTSPIISNLICRRLDNRLIDFAKENHLSYTRYADDISFSSNLSRIPKALGELVDGHFILSKELSAIIEDENGFKINSDKVRYMPSSMRQEVTGLVVNEKTNVSRHYVRQVRAMLHAWERYGIKEASKEHFSRFKPMAVSNPEARFSMEVQGKINFIGDIRGKDDIVYTRLCQMLWKLEPKAKLKVSYPMGAFDAVVFCEGPSDGYHLRAALRSFQEKGEFLDLQVLFYQYKKDQNVSNSELKMLMEYKIKWANPNRTEIYLFDRDDKDYYDMENPDGSPICHKQSIYSLLLPIVSHRKSPRVCIEHFYNNDDLLKKDSNGRRIFLSTEFDRKTARCEVEDVITTTRKALYCDYEYIIDKNVMNQYDQNVALSKMAFAMNVYNRKPPFDEMDFSHFAYIFLKIRDVLLMAKENTKYDSGRTVDE